jgi:hypothetical protein
MQAIAIYFIKCFVCSAILYLYYLLALRNKKFHYYNRFYILLSLLLSIALPLLRLQLFTFHSNSDKAVHMMHLIYEGNTEQLTINTQQDTNWWPIISVAFIIICVIHAISLIARIIELNQLKKKYPVTQLGEIDFINTDLSQAPFSFIKNLFWRNDINLEETASKQILQHEITHITQKHSYDKLFMQALLCFYWMQPFFWLFRKELYMVHEFIADENAVGNDAQAFATMLLSNNFNKQVFSPAQSFSYSPIKRRLIMITTSKQSRFSYVRRLLVLPVLAITVLLFSFTLQKDRKTSKQSAVTNIADTTEPSMDPKKAIYFIDGKEGTVKDVNPMQIALMNVLKPDEAIKKYGDKGNDGAIEIYTKTFMNKKDNTKPLYVIDGVAQNDDFKLSSINDADIKEIYVWKNDEHTKEYDDRGKNGVIEITTKKHADTTSPASQTNTFEKVDVEARFPGGSEAWKKYLQANLNANTPVDHGAPSGSYTTIVSFLVSENGVISDVKADKDPGYGVGAEAVRIIEHGPLWQPATIDGKPVTYRQKQSITFQVSEDKPAKKHS